MNEEEILTTMANQVITMVCPCTARFYRCRVVAQADAETARTDGETLIVLPAAFLGAPLADRPDLRLGLVAHEVAHFFQPLDALRRLEQEEGAPHWLANLLADSNGEMLVERVFSPLTGPLQAVRAHVWTTRGQAFREQFAAAGTFAERARLVLLMARFAQPAAAFTPDTRHFGVAVTEAPLERLLCQASCATVEPPARLPDLVRDILRAFPELRDDRPPYGRSPDYGARAEGCHGGQRGGSAGGWQPDELAAPGAETAAQPVVGDRHGELTAGPRSQNVPRALEREAQQALGGGMGEGSCQALRDARPFFRPQPVPPEARKLARRLRGRWGAPLGLDVWRRSGSTGWRSCGARCRTAWHSRRCIAIRRRRRWCWPSTAHPR